MKKLTIEDKLGCNKFHTDETHCHIDLDKDFQDREALDQLVRVCPAALYKQRDDGSVQLEYLGCLECGTCRVLSIGKAIKGWHYPNSSYGVQYRFG